MEYDRTKRDSKCEGCDCFYGILDDATAENIKNITQITPYKAKVKISDAVMDKYEPKGLSNVVSNRL